MKEACPHHITLPTANIRQTVPGSLLDRRCISQNSVWRAFLPRWFLISRKDWGLLVLLIIALRRAGWRTISLQVCIIRSILASCEFVLSVSATSSWKRKRKQWERFRNLNFRQDPKWEVNLGVNDCSSRNSSLSSASLEIIRGSSIAFCQETDASYWNFWPELSWAQETELLGPWIAISVLPRHTKISFMSLTLQWCFVSTAIHVMCVNVCSC